MDLQESLLRNVLGGLKITYFPKCDGANLLLVLSDQVFKSTLITREDTLDQCNVVISHWTSPERLFYQGSYAITHFTNRCTYTISD